MSIDHSSWSCDFADGGCCNPHGCHCAEITKQSKRITELEKALKEAMHAVAAVRKIALADARAAVVTKYGKVNAAAAAIQELLDEDYARKVLI
jgi:hypothetical protein